MQKIINNFTIPYKIIGKGQPVFLLPPWPVSSEVFDNYLKYADLENYSYILFDLPGWGNKLEHKIEPTTQFYSDIVSQFINSFNLPEYSVIAYSLGVAFVFPAIKNKTINPKKIIIISPVFDIQDVLNSKHFAIGYKAINFLYKIRFPHIIAKIFVLIKYWMEVLTKSYYRKPQNLEVMKKMMRIGWRSSFDSALKPIVTLEDYKKEDIEQYINNTMFIYCTNEQSYLKEIFKKQIEKFGFKFVESQGYDHRYFTFEPQHSVKYINEFLSA